MKSIVTLVFTFVSIGLFAQVRTATNTTTPTTNDPRVAASSTQASVRETGPLPYDVNDKYMGRKDEFLNSMIVKTLPEDFPIYDKSWGVKEYNAVVEAYYTTHMDILKDRVKEKMLMLHPNLKK